MVRYGNIRGYYMVTYGYIVGLDRKAKIKST